MSCYIVEDKHIYYLACVALGCQIKYEWGGQTHCVDHADKAVRIAEEMFRENHASYFARYNEVYNIDPVDPKFIRPCTKADTTVAQIVKSIDCLDYQSCEHKEWGNSQARTFLGALRDRVMLTAETYKELGERCPVGYDDAEWGCCPKFELVEVKPITRSPMMQQWDELRGQLDPDVVLIFRLGDFYELFYLDAERCAKLLNITLTHRNGMPMAGIPYHVKDQYVETLLSHGLSVAICEAREGGGRELTQIIRPPATKPTGYDALKPREKIAQARTALDWLEPYLPPQQRRTIEGNFTGEEGEYFCDLSADLMEQIMLAPVTYQQRDEKDPIVHAHYFGHNYDTWIIEFDKGDPDEPDDRGQHQAYGYCRFAHMPECAELGYVSIPELMENNIELDFHWTPKPLSQVIPGL